MNEYHPLATGLAPDDGLDVADVAPYEDYRHPSQHHPNEQNVDPNTPHDSVHSILLRNLRNSGENISETSWEKRDDVTWRPFWLRPTVLGSFGFLFLCFTVALPVMLYYSRHEDGLFGARQDLVYLWRFGPTAVLTLVAILWSRVELQAMRYLPWMAIQTGQVHSLKVGPDEYSLDYTQMLLPMVLLRSLRKKHLLVFFTVTTGIILKVQIVLVASFFQLASLRVQRPVDIQTSSSFAVTTDLSNNTSFGPYYNARSIQNFDMSFPFGVEETFAYQTFESGTGDTQGRGTVDVPLKATVDAAFIDMDCLAMQSFSVAQMNEVNSSGYYNVTINIKFEQCDQTINITNTQVDWQPSGDNGPVIYWTVEDALEPARPCSSLPQQYPQFVYVASYYGPSPENKFLPHLDTCAAVICSPTAWTTKVDVIDDGIHPNFTFPPNQARINMSSNPWHMLQNTIPTKFGNLIGSAEGAADGPVPVAFEFRGESLNKTDKSLYQNSILEESIMNLTRQIGPMISHYELRQAQTSQISGWSLPEIYRLEVNQPICVSMAVLFGIAMAIVFWALFYSRKPSKVWNRDPATLLGSMLFFHNGGTLGSNITYSLSQGRDIRKEKWIQSTYSPLILRWWTRSLVTIYVGGLIAGLIITLRISQTSDGLATVTDTSYSTLLWKSVPALAMLIVALYVSSVDAAIRDLATLWSLSTRPCSVRELDRSLLDMLGLRALYHSIRCRIPAVTLSQSLATICSFLTTVVAVLFTSQAVPKITSTQFQQRSWFSSIDYNLGSRGGIPFGLDRATLSGFLLTLRLSNVTYPKNTYADLVFPTLGLSDSDWNNSISVNVTVPAAKLLPSCVKLSDKDFNITTGNWTEAGTTYYNATITQHATCPNGSATTLVDYLFMGEGTQRYGSSYVANRLSSIGNLNELPCGLALDDRERYYGTWRERTYAWGQFLSDKTDFGYLSIWRCSYSWAEIPTNLTLVMANGSIQIDHNNPPISDNSSIRPWNPPFFLPHVDDSSINIQVGSAFPDVRTPDPAGGHFDDQFNPLFKPYGSLELEDLGHSDKEDQVLEGLNFNIGFASAQLVNIEQRFDLDGNSTLALTPHGDLAPVNATITYHDSYRLIQNEIITLVLIGILSLVFIVNIWALVSTCLRHLGGGRRSWLLDMELKGLVPEGFSSIAMTESLLHGTNAVRYMPRDAYLMPLKQLYESLASQRFRIGWFMITRYGGSDFTMGMMNDASFEFLEEKRRA